MAAGRRVFVGIEMYPYTEQTSLDKWSAGELTEDAFLKDSRWYKNWGYHWLYYRDIFTFARDHKIRGRSQEVLRQSHTRGSGPHPEQDRHHQAARSLRGLDI